MSQFIDLQKINEINVITLSLKKWLRWAVKKTMLWKWTHDQFNFYWSDECSEAVKKIKKLCQIFIDSQNKRNWKIFFHANDCKQKVIYETKILKFWKTINTNAANKKNCDIWLNESKSKVIFWMNCQKCPHWLKTRKKTFTKNWQHFLKTKHGFWLINFFRLHSRLIWVTFLTQRIWCWCTVQQSLWKKNDWNHEKIEFE